MSHCDQEDWVIKDTIINMLNTKTQALHFSNKYIGQCKDKLEDIYIYIYIYIHRQSTAMSCTVRL